MGGTGVGARVPVHANDQHDTQGWRLIVSVSQVVAGSIALLISILFVVRFRAVSAFFEELAEMVQFLPGPPFPEWLTTTLALLVMLPVGILMLVNGIGV